MFFTVLIFHLYFSHKSKMYFLEVECILLCLQGRGNLHNINPYMAQLSASLALSLLHPLIDSFI